MYPQYNNNRTLKIKLKIKTFNGSSMPEKIKFKFIWALVAHVCNPKYSAGRDQEDHGFKASPM
jgi:hypothetical protein